MRNPLPLDESNILSWVHIGDLHIVGENEQNYRDFRMLTGAAEKYLGHGGVNFAFLPGDNAENGTEPQYRLVRSAIDGLSLPLQIIPGDHDIQTGNLSLFRKHLCSELHRSFVSGAYRCIFLNSVDIEGTKGFDIGSEQLAWLARELEAAALQKQRAIIFMHTYPSELGKSAPAVSELLRRHEVLLVDMGHTHYNEISNDGRTLYTATRSTGQIEEGPPGFSLTNIDHGIVSWKFKALASGWPFAMITSPGESAFITNPGETGQIARGKVEVRLKCWDAHPIVRVQCRVGGGGSQAMSRIGSTPVWRWPWDSSGFENGPHQLNACVENSKGDTAEDTITVISDQSGQHVPPARQRGDNSNAIDAHVEKGILGTQLGPNKNGRKW